jgi:hypothetical protein
MRRHLITILIFLLAGAVVNVAVAWGCALGSKSLDLAPGTERYNPISDDERQRFIKLGWQPLEPGGRTTDARLLGADFVSFGFVSHWVEEREDWSEGGRHGYRHWSVFNQDSAGWPLLTMNGERWEASPPTAPWGSPELWVYRAAVLVPQHDGLPNLPWDRLLPLRPIWPGFAINTIFYAAILWLLIPGPFVFRRYIRRRRGLCPWCAYPMGEAEVCTECGRPLPKRAVA